MNVERSYLIWEDDSRRASIEFGTSSWDNSVRSIRHRVDDKINRKFLPHNSSELSLDALKELVEQAMREDEFDNAELQSIINTANEVLQSRS